MSRGALIVVLAVSCVLCAAPSVSAQAIDCDNLPTSALTVPPEVLAQCIGPAVPADPPPGARAPDSPAFAMELYLRQELVEHPLGNLGAQTFVGSQTASLFAMDFDPAGGTLYALHYDAQQLGILSTTDASFSPIGSAVPLPGESWSGLAFDPRDGTLYASSTSTAISTLYEINPGTGAATPIGSQTDAPAIIDIAMSCSGELYGTDLVTNSLYGIDTETGAATLIGAVGFDLNFAQGLTFDRERDELYAYAYTNDFGNVYGTIDLDTGALTPISVNNPDGEYSGASRTSCADVLVFSYPCLGSSEHIIDALDLLEVPYARAPDTGAFAEALAGRSWDIVLVDNYGPFLGVAASLVQGHVEGGRRAFVSSYDWFQPENQSLAIAMGAAYTGAYTAPLDIFRWDTSHPLFTVPQSVPDLVATDDTCNGDGARFALLEGSTAIGGYTPSSTLGESAVILANGGRTILLGGTLGLFNGNDDGDIAPDGLELAYNVVDYLLTGAIFADGFESGNTSAWSSSVGE